MIVGSTSIETKRPVVKQKRLVIQSVQLKYDVKSETYSGSK